MSAWRGLSAAVRLPPEPNVPCPRSSGACAPPFASGRARLNGHARQTHPLLHCADASLENRIDRVLFPVLPKVNVKCCSGSNAAIPSGQDAHAHGGQRQGGA
ncbi:hypothetical protein ACFOEY_01495 [Paracandidimonas soli]|uniref:hypothetical protein n=1 Tax=Paracandidimonas soli TaxID=1917182 RepID=UPI00360AD35F